MSMFEQGVQTSEAMQRVAHGPRMLIPALVGCRHCQTARMIAAPVLGFCDDCGAELSVLSSPAQDDTDCAART
jgi:hypothetical protein